jgi:ABC-type enterochelin transport system substrate-binding protein
MQEERATRSNAQQIERLDKMFGKGKGAKKERARLEKPSEEKAKG